MVLCNGPPILLNKCFKQLGFWFPFTLWGPKDIQLESWPVHKWFQISKQSNSNLWGPFCLCIKIRYFSRVVKTNQLVLFKMAYFGLVSKRVRLYWPIFKWASIMLTRLTRCRLVGHTGQVVSSHFFFLFYKSWRKLISSIFDQYFG